MNSGEKNIQVILKKTDSNYSSTKLLLTVKWQWQDFDLNSLSYIFTCFMTGKPLTLRFYIYVGYSFFNILHSILWYYHSCGFFIIFNSKINFLKIHICSLLYVTSRIGIILCLLFLKFIILELMILNLYKENWLINRCQRWRLFLPWLKETT